MANFSLDFAPVAIDYTGGDHKTAV